VDCKSINESWSRFDSYLRHIIGHQYIIYFIESKGGVTEWTKVAVLKTDV
jgi:hypothetical protein